MPSLKGAKKAIKKGVRFFNSPSSSRAQSEEASLSSHETVRQASIDEVDTLLGQRLVYLRESRDQLQQQMHDHLTHYVDGQIDIDDLSEKVEQLSAYRGCFS